MHPVSQEIAENDLAIWKANLMGGNQLYYLVNRVKQLRTLKAFIDNKKDTSNWEIGLGYQVAQKTDKAPHLTGKLMVETSDFKEEAIIKTQIETEKNFQRSREPHKNIFLAPHLLIKRSMGKSKFITHCIEYDLIFKERIIGIHAPKGQEHILRHIESTLNSNYFFYKLFLLAISAEAGISRSGGYTVYLKDILSLPYPENIKDLELSYSEEIIKDDVLKYKLEELTRGEKAKINTQQVADPNLEEFGKVLCNSLNPIYQKGDKKFKALPPIKTLSYTCFPFVYGDDTFTPQISAKIQDGDLSELMENQQESVHYRRILRLYQKDIVFLVKPNTLKYWLKSIALRDAGDIMNDFINSGY